MARPLRTLLLAAAPVVVVAAIGVGLVRFARREGPAGPGVAATGNASGIDPGKPAGPAELALVAPLAKGSDLGGFVVQEIDGVEEGTMRVVCTKERAAVRLFVALADEEGALAPATAGRFAVFYAARGATPEDAEMLSKKLAAVIGANASAAAPAGMTTFKPKPKPGTAL